MRLIVLVSMCGLLVVCVAGCGRSNDPATASDDDLYRAEARAEGVDEDHAVLLARRHKDEDPLAYMDQTRKLRLLIKYYKGDAGDCTLDEYVALATAKREMQVTRLTAEQLARWRESQARQDEIRKAQNEAMEAYDKKAEADRAAREQEYETKLAVTMQLHTKAQAVFWNLTAVLGDPSQRRYIPGRPYASEDEFKRVQSEDEAKLADAKKWRDDTEPARLRQEHNEKEKELADQEAAKRKAYLNNITKEITARIMAAHPSGRVLGPENVPT